MNNLSYNETTEKIALVIGNQPLAVAIQRSLALTLECPFVRLPADKTVWNLFERSLNAAIRDIVEHPRGRLFQRLIEFGPHDPDYPETPDSDNETILSDPECASAVQFIFSHMVNRFKGELAELLALEPCIKLVHLLQDKGDLPSKMTLYWGETVKERRRFVRAGHRKDIHWGSFTWGADGLLVKHRPATSDESATSIRIQGVVEIKSMPCSKRKILAQIERHIIRLGGGVELVGNRFSQDTIHLDNSSVIRIMVLTSNWKLSRNWRYESDGNTLVPSEISEPPVKTRTEELKSNIWKITLDWSKESLEQAAYEMTFGYMASVGRHIYTKKISLPKTWEYMTPNEAGYNAIKMMLYFILLRPLSERQERRAIKLYNIYSFGYPLGVDSKEMLWPQDLSN